MRKIGQYHLQGYNSNVILGKTSTVTGSGAPRVTERRPIVVMPVLRLVRRHHEFGDYCNKNAQNIATD